MKYRYLGSTGLSVSELCFGAMTFGEKGAFLGAPGRNWSEFGVVPEHTAYDLVYKALDAGINFFDTADCYKNGQGEELLGNALKGKRQQVIIGTKGRWQTDPNPNALGASRYHIINAVDASLQRLKTDYIDIYHLHGFDPRTALEDTLRTLDALIRAGKIRYIGVSNYAAWQLAKALGISERLGLEKFCVYQGYYNIAARELEHEIIPLSVDQNVGITVWSPLAGGFLTGKYPRNQAFPEGSRLANQVTKATDAPTTISGTAYVVNTLMLVVASAAVIIYSSALPEIRTTVFLSIISFTFFAFCVSTQNMALNIRQQANRGRFLKNGFIRISPVRSIWPQRIINPTSIT